MHFFILIASILPIISSTCALSTVRTYRGESRYKTMYTREEDLPPIPNFPNPKSNPEFYSHKFTQEYQSQGHEEVVPKWARSIKEAFNNNIDIFTSTRKLLYCYYFYARTQFNLGELYVDCKAESKTINLLIEQDTAANHLLSSEDLIDNDTEIQYNLPADSGFDYMNDKVRGVNIGNWLLFELWMDSNLSNSLNNHAINAPGPNSIIDEWTAGLYSDPAWATHVLTEHFDTWITEQDFIEIKAAGLNHIRIPFPYWGFAEAVGPAAPYFTPCGWARSLGLKVWVDIHGVPGSQNGYDNSGRSGPIHWASKPDYYTRTQYTFNRLATFFSQPEWKGTVTAVEAVNEPAANVNSDVANLINEYYPWARNAVARPPNSTELTSLLLAMHDGFLGPLHWQGFITGKPARRILLDTHSYFVYSQEEKTDGDTARIKQVCSMENTLTQSQNNYPTVTGEWSVSGPNGDQPSDRNLPNAPFSFPDGPAYPFSKGYMAFMARNYAVQTKTFERGSGWIFWAWKNRNDLDWSYQAGLQYGWIQTITDSVTPWSRFGDDPCADFR